MQGLQYFADCRVGKGATCVSQCLPSMRQKICTVTMSVSE